MAIKDEAQRLLRTAEAPKKLTKLTFKPHTTQTNYSGSPQPIHANANHVAKESRASGFFTATNTSKCDEQLTVSGSQTLTI